MKNKPIICANLALRFYIKDGWTEEDLMECCTHGRALITHPQDPPNERYYSYDHTMSSQFDAKKLLGKATNVVRIFNDHPNDTDEEFIDRYNRW